MENQTTAFLRKTVGINYGKEDTTLPLENIQVIIGILGMLLPVLLILFLYVDTCHFGALESISHYYYTRVNGIFFIIMSFLAFFLLIYKGREPIDFYISLIAAVSALCVLLFPTSNLSASCTQEKFVIVTELSPHKGREMFHYISAGLFLAALAFMSLFLFTRSDKALANRTKNKWWRNFICRFCGYVMIAAMLVILAGKYLIVEGENKDCDPLTFWMEVVAVEAFGISWLIKSKWIIKD